MGFIGLPGGSSSGEEGDLAVFGRLFAVLFWLLVVCAIGGFLWALFYAANQLSLNDHSARQAEYPNVKGRLAINFHARPHPACPDGNEDWSANLAAS
jgi:hypothetical protein